MHALRSNSALARPLDDLAQVAGGVWTLTLWTVGRAPLLVGIGREGLGLTPLGRLVDEECRGIERRFPEVLRDEFVVLPDRVRILVHVPPSSARLSVGRLVAWLKARVGRRARAAGLAAAALWETGYEGQVLLGPEELAICRRRIRAGLSGLGEPARVR